MLTFVGTTLTVTVCLVALFCDTTRGQYGGDTNIKLPTFNRREELGVRNVKAKELLKYMNLEADPCADFYDFACGKWADFNSANKEGELITVQSELETEVKEELRKILEEPLMQNDGLSARKVKEFYKSCLTVERSSPLQQTFLMNFAKRYGGFPSVAGTNWNTNYNWVRVIAMLHADYGFDILIGLEIDTNAHSMRGNSIYLAEPKSTLIPIALCSAMATQETDLKDQVYNDIQREISDNMQSWFSLKETEASRFSGDIVRFEFELCKKMRLEQSIPTQEENEINDNSNQLEQSFRTGQSRLYGNRNSVRYPRQTLQQLTQKFGIIDFKQFVDTIFAMPINDYVYMRSETYFHHLARTIRSSATPTIANYIMYRALSTFNFPSDDSSVRRPRFCVELIQRYFPKVIGELYNRKSHRSESRSDLELLYGAISKTFEESLKVEWLDENARRTAVQKLAQINVQFPVYQNLDLNDLAIERSNYWNKLNTVMKYNAKQELARIHNTDAESIIDSVEAPDVCMKLMPVENAIRTGWGILHEPLYHFYYPNSLKYALIGQHLAHELVKAFDEQGWKSNPMSPMRWDEYTAENFHNRSECYRTQYSNYLHNTPDVYRNASKLREIIADSSGLNVAFNAYLAWLDSIDSSNRATLSKETLPEVNFSNTQLFFIHFAQSRCAAKTDEEPLPEYLPLDKHTSERYDVNGPLANNIEFAREFNCGAGTEMNPDDKCTLY